MTESNQNKTFEAKSLFDKIPNNLPAEVFENLVVTPNMRIERIISHGHSSPDEKTGDGQWYNQNQNEWVMVVKGHAKLRFEKDNQLIELKPGMHIDIKAHVKHKVEWTTPDEPTIWLAVFY